MVKFAANNTAQVFALGNINAGDELTHSYIENENSLEERISELRTYGFSCDCPKCLYDLQNKDMQ